MFLNIEIKHHLLLFCLATTLWVFFLLGGLSSDYYLTWPFIKSLIIVDILPAILLIPLSYYILKYVIGHHFIKAAFIGAFYASVPLVIYDYLYIAVHLNKGMSFLTAYWYLTVFYFIPWVIIPLVGYVIKIKKTS